MEASGKLHTSAPLPFNTSHWTGEWPGSDASLDIVMGTKILAPAGNQIGLINTDLFLFKGGGLTLYQVKTGLPATEKKVYRIQKEIKNCWSWDY